MATKQGITLHEGNTETIRITIDRADATDDLTAVTAVEVLIKDGSCVADADALVLSSADPAELVITAQSAAQITAEAYVPPSATIPPHVRFWRADALVGAARRTALYGPVAVVNL